MAQLDVHLASNLVTAVSYYVLTYQLLQFVRSSQLVRFLSVLQNSRDRRKRSLFLMLVALAVLFALFISLCGTTHAFSAARYFYPTSAAWKMAQTVMLAVCAAVSLITAMVGYRLFPIILEVLAKYELNGEGNLHHVENYLIEVVEMVQESVLVLGDDLKISRFNEASKLLLRSADLLGRRVTDFIYPEDRILFEETMLATLSGYSQVPITFEYRIAKAAVADDPAPMSPRFKQTFRPGQTSQGKIYPTIEMHPTYSQLPHNASIHSTAAPSVGSGPSQIGLSVGGIGNVLGGSNPNSVRGGASVIAFSAGDADNDAPADFVWVESTVCKGMRLTPSDDFEYDLKMITRNIDDRKKQAENAYKNILRESEEQKHINAAKLRYISCIAHDLKTPLQSFCFSLDLLQQTPLSAEQRDCVQQANVAVDLMKLTISQTMDISKALTGAKLLPRCTTVNLPTVLERVKIIINGYGKQVPITFHMDHDICDAIITDEEWLWQMLLNLLTNACKYTDKGNIAVEISTTTEVALPGTDKVTSTVPGRDALSVASKPSKALLFEVIDTGVGVNAAKIDHLFDAFSQVQDGQVTGTGLGLFGVRARAEGLQGTCGARANTNSVTGTGTVIWFAIPYQPDTVTLTWRSAGSYNRLTPLPLPQEGSAGGDSSFTEPALNTHRQYSEVVSLSPESEVSRETGARVGPPLTSSPATPNGMATRMEAYIRGRQLTAMVIDDTLTVRKLMEKLLLRMGFARVACYENGSKGLDAMMAEQVDIVFSDVQMPIMTGPEMVVRFRNFEAEALRTSQRTTRQLIVAVTANGAQLGKAGKAGGFDEVCPKPLSVSDIYHVIQKYL